MAGAAGKDPVALPLQAPRECGAACARPACRRRRRRRRGCLQRGGRTSSRPTRPTRPTSEEATLQDTIGYRGHSRLPSRNSPALRIQVCESGAPKACQSSRFRRGSIEVPSRFCRGSVEVPSRFCRGSGDQVPKNLREIVSVSMSVQETPAQHASRSWTTGASSPGRASRKVGKAAKAHQDATHTNPSFTGLR